MSCVTTATLIVDAIAPASTIEELKEGPDDDLADISDVRFTVNVADDRGENPQCSGSKFPCCDVYIGAFNHLSTPRLIKWLKGLDWGEDSRVVLVLVSEHETAEVVPIVGDIKIRAD
jgi:hypothetical protein